jgi:hypothetical protein
MLQSSQHCLRKPDYYLHLQGYFACPPGPCSRMLQVVQGRIVCVIKHPKDSLYSTTVHTSQNNRSSYSCCTSAKKVGCCSFWINPPGSRAAPYCCSRCRGTLPQTSTATGTHCNSLQESYGKATTEVVWDCLRAADPLHRTFNWRCLRTRREYITVTRRI